MSLLRVRCKGGCKVTGEGTFGQLLAFMRSIEKITCDRGLREMSGRMTQEGRGTKMSKVDRDNVADYSVRQW